MPLNLLSLELMGLIGFLHYFYSLKPLNKLESHFTENTLQELTDKNNSLTEDTVLKLAKKV